MGRCTCAADSITGGPKWAATRRTMVSHSPQKERLEYVRVISPAFETTPYRGDFLQTRELQCLRRTGRVPRYQLLGTKVEENAQIRAQFASNLCGSHQSRRKVHRFGAKCGGICLDVETVETAVEASPDVALEPAAMCNSVSLWFLQHTKKTRVASVGRTRDSLAHA